MDWPALRAEASFVVTTPLNAELASARKLEFRVGRSRVALFKEKGEAASAVALRVWAWLVASTQPQAWGLPEGLRWELDPRLPGRGVKPSVAGFGPDGSVVAWVATQPLHPDELLQLLKQRHMTQVVLVDAPPVPEEELMAMDQAALQEALAPSVAWYRKHVHYRYANGRLTLVRVAPLESWLDPQAVEVSPDRFVVHGF